MDVLVLADKLDHCYQNLMVYLTVMGWGNWSQLLAENLKIAEGDSQILQLHIITHFTFFYCKICSILCSFILA